MKNRFYPTLSIVILTCVSGLAQQILSVTNAGQPPYDDMTNLIRDHLTGAGVEIISVESNNSPTAIGYFTDGNSSIGINRGLILTSGSASDAQESGSVFADNDNTGLNVQPELEVIATNALRDVAYFRIKFRPFSDSIRFRYVFGSEEYPEYACSDFNDVFGFFLTGPNPAGGNYDDLNIALIPGTNLPVSINNLHIENPVNQQSCPAFNAQFYHDNLNSFDQPVYDGFTDVFVAEASVIPCATYEMVLAISDVGDAAFDSGVFLEAKSLQSVITVSSTLTLGEDVIPEVATADTISFSFGDVPAGLLPLQIKLVGTATNGVDYQAVDSVTIVNFSTDVIHFVIQPIQDSVQEQLETVVFNVCGTGTNDCFSKTFTLFIADPDSLYSPVDSVFFLTGGSTILEVFPTSISNKLWTFSNSTAFPITQPRTMILSKIVVDMPFEILQDVSLLQSVCMNIDHSWDDDLNIYLFAPNQTFAELSTDNGGNGNGYLNTCFSPAATQDIRGGFPFAPASAAPFTGTFQPEGLWSDIQNTPISGTWTLGVLDDADNQIGTLQDWSITFSTAALGNFKYYWSTGDTSSNILVNAPGIYNVTISNLVGSFSKKFVVQEGTVATHSPLNEAQVFHLFPNPSSGETMLVLDQNIEMTALKVYNLNGTLVLQQTSAGPIQGANNLPKGLYLVVLESPSGTFVQKLMRW